MTAPACDDPISDVINAFLTALRAAYDPASSCPPDGLTAIPAVQFFAGDGAPLAAWDAHSIDPGCDVPFIWIRLASRFRSKEFPAPATGAITCDVPGVAELEMGVAWCALVNSSPSPDDYAAEAETSLDHSWRLEQARCRAAALLRADNHTVAFDAITPYGPEGGILAWMTTTYVSF